jgi:hypothetical protein
MTLLTRSTIVTGILAVVLTATAAPAPAIVGGHDATQTYPGVAAAQIVHPGLGTALCGATLVDPRWALIAAHCVSDHFAEPTPVAVPGGTITLRVGSNDRTTGGHLVTGKKVHLHPDWTWGTTWPAAPVADLALVELARPVRTPLLRLATGQVPEGAAVRLIGWGITAHPPAPGTVPPAILQQRDSSRLPDAACTGGFIGTGDICMDRGACYGDSASPALRRVAFGHLPTRVWASVGLVSRAGKHRQPVWQSGRLHRPHVSAVPAVDRDGHQQAPAPAVHLPPDRPHHGDQPPPDRHAQTPVPPVATSSATPGPATRSAQH